AAVAPLSGGCILEHHHFVLQVFDLDARIRIGKLAAARQFNTQVGARAFQQQSTATNDLLANAYRFPRRAIDGVPQLLDVGLRCAPVLLALLRLRISESIRLEFAPGIQSGVITECEIAGLADFALR